MEQIEVIKNMIKEYMSNDKAGGLYLLDSDCEIILKALEQEQYYKDLANSYEKTINKLTKAISEQEPKTEWIPVTERLPETDGDYLVTCHYLTHDSIYVASFTKNLHKIDDLVFEDKKGISGWYDFDSEVGYYEVENVNAWQSLPEPYKGVEE